MENESSDIGYRVLVLGLTDPVSSMASSVLEYAGYRTVSLSSFEDLKKNSHFDVIVVDASMFAAEAESFRRLFEDFDEAPQCVLVSETSIDPEVLSLFLKDCREQSVWVLRAPFSSDELLTAVVKACVVSELSKDNRDLRAAIGASLAHVDLLGSSNLMSEIFGKAKKVANLDSPVLLTGESGTGKSAFARYIHRHSSRANKPFVTVSCPAIPRDLLEAELFGYEKGAFTGALSSRPGCFEVADGGTLFLDELGELPIDLQPKLLNVLQDFQVKRVGGSKSRKIDVRIISATNVNLVENCEAGCFREDLYYRLHVLPIEIPPLRDRGSDLFELSSALLERIAARREQSAHYLSADAKKALEQYSWPGNIRELENVLERATAFAEHRELSVQDLGLPAVSASTDGVEFSLAGFTLKELEQKAVKDTLLACEGDKSKAAESLGISLKSVYNKLQQDSK